MYDFSVKANDFEIEFVCTVSIIYEGKMLVMLNVCKE